MPKKYARVDSVLLSSLQYHIWDRPSTGHRCVVTRSWDYPSLSLPHVVDEFDPSTDTSTVTGATHISVLLDEL
jgi:hypothetical protein